MSEPKRLIGITGRAGAGKDTVKDLIKQNIFPELSAYSFAAPIYDTVMNLFGWTLEELQNRDFKEAIDPKWGFSPRRAMQLFGTEFGRTLREDLWIHHARVLLDSPIIEGLLISDVRFENEADFIRSHPGGLIIHVTRPNNPNEISEGHASEGGVAFVHGDISITNDGTIDDMLYKLRDVLNKKHPFA